MDHKTVDSDLARKFFNLKIMRENKNISHILILFLWRLSVISLTKFNTKWGSKRKLENPVSVNQKRDRKPGSNNVGHFSY